MTTGRDAVSYGNGVARAPKRDLVGVAQAALQTSRLRIAADLPKAKAMIQGLQNFQVKITAAANDVYGAWREGTHDDLVLAVTPALLTIVLTIMLQGYTQLGGFDKVELALFSENN
jgi:hypothetical protein